MKKLLCLFLALLLVISAAVPVLAADSDVTACIRKMLVYYRYHQEDAALDQELLRIQLSLLDEKQAQNWDQIMKYWSWVNTELDNSTQRLPDNLPQDDSLCIVVLGYALQRNGDLQDELIGRLNVALSCAEQYPNAYLVCTGGPTARNSSVTEAGQMARWLIRHGVAEDRIILEEKSLSTVNNAQYTCQLLNSQYPQVTQLAIVTSDYHQGRGPLLFEAESILKDYPTRVVATASYQTDNHNLDSVKVQADALAYLAGISIDDAQKPTLSKLQELRISGSTQYTVGQELNLRVYAVYSNGFSREISGKVKYAGLDFGKAGTQTVTIQYPENGTVYTAYVDVEFLPASTDAPSNPVQETEIAVPLSAPAPLDEPQAPPPILIGILVTLLCLLIVLLVLKKRKK